MNISQMKGLSGHRMPDFSAMREKMFKSADANGDQALSLEEFTNAGKNLPVGNNASPDKAKNAFAKLDSDGNGSLSQDEIRAHGDRMSSQMQGMMLAMQSMMNDGQSKPQPGGRKPDLDAILGKSGSDQSLQDAFARIDSNGDGSLGKDELTAFAESLRERSAGGRGQATSSRDEYMQAMNAYTNGSTKGDLAEMLLKALDGGRNQADQRQASKPIASGGVRA
jgi:Ca2+-binding EF-hand superfamily protein